MADPVLSKADLLSPVWLKLSEHLTREVATLRVRNDRPTSSEDTAFLRGQIDGLKQILALAKPRQVPPELDA